MEAFVASMVKVTAKYEQEAGSLQLVNEGFCWYWANDVVDEFYETQEKDYSDDLVIVGDDDMGHYYVKFRGKCYDAESLDGVGGPRELPLASRISEYLRLIDKSS